MARTIRVIKIELLDNDGIGPVRGEATVKVTDDDAGAVALGMSEKFDVRRVALSRAAFNSLVSALRRPSGDDFPDGTLPHPIAKDP